TALRPQDIVWPAVAVVALLALGLYGLVRVGRGRALGLAVGYQLAPLALGLITLVHTTQFGARFLFLGSPGYVLALAGAIVLLARLQWAWSVAPLALMGGLAGLAVHNMTFSDQFSDKAYSRLAAELARRIGPKDAVVLDGVSQSLQYWYYGQLRDGIGQPVAILPLDRTGNGADGTPVDIDRTRQAIDQLASGRTGLWLIDDDSLRYDPNLDTQRILASESFRASSQGFRGQRLDYYAIGRPGPMATTSVKLDGVSLMGTSRLDHNVPAGRAAPIALAWQSARDNPPAFKESLRLLDGSGALVAQDDEPAGQGFWPASWPAGTSRQENRGLLIPVGTPPGAYKLQLVAYEAGSGKSLGQPVELGPVQVDHSAPQRPEAAGLQPANVTLGGERLVGLGLAPEVDAGEKLPLTLLWSGTTAPDAESVTVTFGGTSIVHQIGGGYSTNQWQPADVVRDQIPIRVPATMQPGEYPLLAGQTQLAKVRVLPTKRLFSPPPMPHVSNARFGDVAQLLGYDLEPGAGGIQLRLVWKALNETPVSYTVFVHALGDDGKIRAQVDQAPGTDHWDSGQIVPASYALAASGDYKLEIGMYDAAKGTRLPVCMAVSGCLEPADHLDLPPK
ncbi:MAG TPA: hypothetical protein VF157_08210, partial [Chloroflexota bacterium]